MRLKNFLLAACLAVFAFSFPLGAQEEESNPLNYKRSSLCLVLISHDKGTYSDEIKEEFLKMGTPLRYNGIVIPTRVFVTTKKNLKKTEIDAFLKEGQVGRELVEHWFDYNPSTNCMNMDYIHQRGGYSASYSQFRKAESMERGMAMLTDSGIDLLNNTFVLVCDMDYYNKENTGKALSAALALGAAALSIYAASTSSSSSASLARAGAAAAGAGAIVASDLGGFSVNMHAYLYRLGWNPEIQGAFFDECWSDSSMSPEERQAKAANLAQMKFPLEYVDEYSEKTGKTVFKSANDLHRVIREVCNNTLVAGVNRLAEKNDEFKPKSTFYCEDDKVYSYIGTKEGVTRKSYYEIVSMAKKSKTSYSYKRQAKLIPETIWDNRNFNFATDSLGTIKGTSFKSESGSVAGLDDMGYTLREYVKPAVVVLTHFDVDYGPYAQLGARVSVSGTLGGYMQFGAGINGYKGFTIGGGLVGRLSPRVYLYGGSGYASDNYHATGAAVLDVGSMFRFGWFSLSAGYFGAFYQSNMYNSFRLGIGFAFGKKK